MKKQGKIYFRDVPYIEQELQNGTKITRLINTYWVYLKV